VLVPYLQLPKGLRLNAGVAAPVTIGVAVDVPLKKS
jgi:hypothetical protein